MPAIAGLCLSACGGVGHRAPRPVAPNSVPAPPPTDYRVVYPAKWRPASQLPHSTYLTFLAIGRSSTLACPEPLQLVRRQPSPRGTLTAAAAYYNRVEDLRRPGRRVLAQRAVAIVGASSAILIVAEFPRTGSRGRTVLSFDLLVLSVHGVAFHVFASGCAADLPARFVERYILSFDAATGNPGADSLRP